MIKYMTVVALLLPYCPASLPHYAVFGQK